MNAKESKRLLFKEILKSITKNKSNVVLLYIFILLTSFMYFFVQFSVDKNMNKLESIIKSGTELNTNQADFLIALQSNSILARTFLILFIVMSAFVVYIFFRQYFNQNQKELGLFKALGFNNILITIAYVKCTILVSALASLAGTALGWIFSSVLLNAYIDSISIFDVEKGANLSSIFYGIILVILIMSFITVLICKIYFQKETALLLNDSDSKKENKVILFVSNKIASLFPKNKRKTIRLILRKPTILFLSIVSVGISIILFIMSISLYLSSDKVFETQTTGHHYFYNIKYDNALQGVDEDNAIPYLESQIDLYLNDDINPITKMIIGISHSQNMLELQDINGKRIEKLPENQIIIGKDIQETYDLKKGDNITISTRDGEKHSVLIADIAENAEMGYIYVNPDQLSTWLDIPQGYYNGLLTNDVSNITAGNVVTAAQRLKELEKDIVSNRMSAIINQILGCVAGSILIYLVLLLNFQDNTKEMLILDLLGYIPKEINKMLISIYRPILMVLFLVIVFPSIYLCKKIHIGLSLQTGDFIPFQTNFIIIIIIFIVIQVIYTIVELSFTRKIKQIVISERIFDNIY